MNVSPSNRIPLHEQVSNMLAQDIQSGAFVDGEKLAPERKMAADLNISVGTLRKALLQLQQRGLLSRIHGSGNYVSRSNELDNPYTQFNLELINGSASPHAILISVDLLEKPNDLPDFGSAETAFRFRRLRFLGEVLAATEEIWLDGSFTDQIDADTVPNSMYQFYREHLGLFISRTEDRIGMSTLPDWALKYWPPKSGLPCGFGYVERMARNQHGKTAEYSRTWFDATSVRFVTRGRI